MWKERTYTNAYLSPSLSMIWRRNKKWFGHSRLVKICTTTWKWNPIVGSVNDQRVIGDTGFLQLIQDETNTLQRNCNRHYLTSESALVLLMVTGSESNPIGYDDGNSNGNGQWRQRMDLVHRSTADNSCHFLPCPHIQLRQLRSASLNKLKHLYLHVSRLVNKVTPLGITDQNGVRCRLLANLWPTDTFAVRSSLSAG